MSLYKVQLSDYGTDFFKIPISCGGRNILLDFAWDMVSQRHADNIRGAIDRLAAANPLVLLPDTTTIVPNEDFVAYIRQLESREEEYSLFAGKWVSVLLQTPGAVAWATLSSELDTLITSFYNQHISFNHFSKMQNFQAYLQSLVALVAGEDATSVLSAIQSAPYDLFDYALSYKEYIDEAEVELAELDELLRWMLTLHYREESFTTSLEVGASHFDQVSDIRLLFESPKDKIGYSDLSSVTLWIGFIDGSN